MSADFKVGDYVTLIHVKGSIGRIDAIPMLNYMHVKWSVLHPWGGPRETLEPLSGKYFRVLSDSEVTLYLLSAETLVEDK